MKVSFDFDGVLTTRAGKEMLTKKVAFGDDVYIITARKKSDSAVVYDFAKRYQIPVTRVIFTTIGKKWQIIKEKGIQLHFDDNPDELRLILENTNAEVEDLDHNEQD